jgi:hypothetical protein
LPAAQRPSRPGLSLLKGADRALDGWRRALDVERSRLRLTAERSSLDITVVLLVEKMSFEASRVLVLTVSLGLMRRAGGWLWQ